MDELLLMENKHFPITLFWLAFVLLMLFLEHKL